MHQMKLLKRWKILIDGLLTIAPNPPVLERWRVLIKSLAYEGYLKLGNLDAMSNKSIILKLRQKQQKLSSMKVLGRWKTLIDGVLRNHKGTT